MKRNLIATLLLSLILVFGVTGCGEKNMATNDDDTHGMIDEDTNIATNEKTVICTKKTSNDTSDDIEEYRLTFNDDRLTYIEIDRSKDYKSDNMLEELYEKAKEEAEEIKNEITEAIASATNNDKNISTNIKIDVEKAKDTLTDQFSIDKDKTRSETIRNLENDNYTCTE